MVTRAHHGRPRTKRTLAHPPRQRHLLHTCANSPRPPLFSHFSCFLPRPPKAVGAGAKVLCGGGAPPDEDAASSGRTPGKGYYVSPTVLAGVEETDEAWTTEIFGPVLCVRTFEDEEEALAAANNSEFGLAASVMSADKERCDWGVRARILRGRTAAIRPLNPRWRLSRVRAAMLPGFFDSRAGRQTDKTDRRCCTERGGRTGPACRTEGWAALLEKGGSSVVGFVARLCLGFQEKEWARC